MRHWKFSQQNQLKNSLYIRINKQSTWLICIIRIINALIDYKNIITMKMFVFVMRDLIENIDKGICPFPFLLLNTRAD